ncbi:cytochrome P450 6k1-like [Rhodnius prolixus]|uniref:cytochrome P450 6k1-like n=1 Tax=Rhodnius prolixus TaxID=13249 RepID=UPI003D18A831
MLNEGLFSNGLFQLSGTIWRSLRYKMSPAFTSGKLKMVFNGMLDCTEEMINLMKKNLHQDYEVQNALITFTIDVIANTVFGVQFNDIIAREEFAKYGTSIFNVTPSRYMQMIMLMQMPKISKMLGFKLMNKDTEEYFRKIIKQTFDQRIGGQNQRNDYLNHLVKLKEKGVIEIQTRDEDDAFLGLDEAPPAENVVK